MPIGWSWRAICDPRVPDWSRHLHAWPHAVTASTSSTSGSRRPTSCTTRRAARRPGGDVHRVAQPRRLQRREAVPVRSPPSRRRHQAWPTSRPRRSSCSTARRLDPDRTPAGAAPNRRCSMNSSEHVLTFIDVADIGPMKVVADTANGMGGLVVPAVLRTASTRGVRDHVPRTRRDVPQPSGLIRLQPRKSAGLAGSGGRRRVRPRAGLRRRRRPGVRGRRERCRAERFDDHRLLAAATLRQHPGATVLHNLICSRTVPEVVAEHGGTPFARGWGTRTSSRCMADTGAVFGGEHSATTTSRAISTPTAD